MPRRKSKQTGGNFPLTHHERTKKLVDGHGTAKVRLAGRSQYQLGSCALSLTEFDAGGAGSTTTDSTAAAADANRSSTGSTTGIVSTPSGYLYEKVAILEYLLSQKQQLEKTRAAYEVQQQRLRKAVADDEDIHDDTAAATPSATKKRKLTAAATGTVDERHIASEKAELKRTSYWLADSQPAPAEDVVMAEPPACPPSPISQQPLRRKDLWPVSLTREEGGGGGDSESTTRKKPIVCAISGKALTTQPVFAYWTDKACKEPGTVVLTKVFDELMASEEKEKQSKKKKKKDDDDDKAQPQQRCPLTGKKIRHKRTLQQSGSSFAASGQAVQVQQYRPTMT